MKIQSDMQLDRIIRCFFFAGFFFALAAFAHAADPNLAKHPDGGVPLSADDKKALVAFLKTLTDETFLSVEK